MNTDEVLRKFIELPDNQKLAVINKLENNKETPAVMLSGLRWLYEMSKTETIEAMYKLISK